MIWVAAKHTVKGIQGSHGPCDEVDGESASSGRLVKMLVERESMQLTIERPQQRELLIKSNSFTSQSMETCGIVVTAVTDGPLKPMDRIIAVEGQEAAVPELFRLMAKDTVTATVLSYS